MSLRVDLNADLGEGAGADLDLLGLVSSASVACGFHAGDPATMARTIAAAKDRGVAVGAHPSFPDREHFGRRELVLSPHELFQIVTYQLGAFDAIARALGVRPRHVKPHGALYNMAARDAGTAEVVARAIEAFDPALVLLAPPASALSVAGEAHELRVVREFFADRNYRADGTLVPRERPDALLHDREEAAARVLRVLAEGKVRTVDGRDIELAAETVCIHGDSPDAIAFARSLRAALENAGIVIAPP